MENQTVVDSAETSQVDNTSVSRSTHPIQVKTNLLIPIMSSVLISGIIFGLGGYYFGQQKTRSQQNYNYTQNQPTIIPTVIPSATGASTLPDMTIFKNPKHGIEFQIPISFVSQQTSEDVLVDGLYYPLADFTNTEGKQLRVNLDTNLFSTEYLKKYAPTGGNDFPPVSQMIGTNTFYYYGPGGGGVCYPDQYFFNLKGKVLIFDFFGCDADKTPSEDFKKIERQILSSFKLLDL